ncbi:NADH dehydrogenase [ubiquinone] 1 alpha subcomplex subunit 12-like [Oscarella lobularis]|uniref:NADH dehydrogenase [ubiquinone] 1 alpha subcomplex subunit 12-like n=1 Tax=Oscarella lobularis TaxID=121494 RepID=UPI0033138FA9
MARRPLLNLGHLLRTVRDAGGVWNVIKRLSRDGPAEIRAGQLVGTDDYGNKYYENKNYIWSRHRWIDFAKWKDFDASQVPPEWHGWLHSMTDDPPTKVPPVKRKFRQDHVENVSGTSRQYVPYSTTRQKIQSWEP